MRAIPQAACSENDSSDNIKGIVHYGTSTADAATPSTTGYTYDDVCEDELMDDLVPIISNTAESSFYADTEEVTVGFNTDNLFKWYLNDTTFQQAWADPTLSQIYNNDTSFNSSGHVISLPNANEWTYIMIQTAAPVSHPVHLHVRSPILTHAIRISPLTSHNRATTSSS